MAFIETTNDWDFEASKVREAFEERFGVFRTIITDAYGDKTDSGAKYVNLEFELVDVKTGVVLGRQNKQFYLTSKAGKTTYTKNNKEFKLPAWHQLASIVAAIKCADTNDKGQKEEVKETLGKWLNDIVEAKKNVFGENKVVAGMPNFIKKPFIVAFTKKWDDYNDTWKAEFSEARCERLTGEKLDEFIEKVDKAIKKAKAPKKKEEKASEEEKAELNSW